MYEGTGDQDLDSAVCVLCNYMETTHVHVTLRKITIAGRRPQAVLYLTKLL